MAKWWPVLLLLGLGLIGLLVYLFRRSDGGSDFLPGLFGGAKGPSIGTAACVGGAAYFGGGAGAAASLPICGQIGPALDPLLQPPLAAAGSGAAGVITAGTGLLSTGINGLSEISPLSWAPDLAATVYGGAKDVVSDVYGGGKAVVGGVLEGVGAVGSAVGTVVTDVYEGGKAVITAPFKLIGGLFG